jgi:signal transduction histidine kinase
LQKKELQFLNKIPPELELFADMNMLSTIFRNLISNAIKFTPRGGRVIVSATKNADGETLIAVRDTGIGIPADMLPVLFKVGAKTSRPGTEGESSTGLGLVLCKEYVEKHGGKIWVESTEGSGTTFFFTIPNQTKE